MPARPPPPRLAWLVAAIVAAASFLPFLPLLQADFVNWDDDHNFVDNPAYRGLSPEHLRWMFTTFHYGGYHPLSWLSAGVDYSLWGMDARGYHLTNLLLHVVNGVLLFRLVVAMLRIRGTATAATVWAAGAAAVLFAVHPLRVESVAWITERRGLLAALFLIGSVHAYLRAHRPGAPGSPLRWLVLSVSLFVLSLLSKGLAMVLPVLLLVLDAYPLRRFGGGAGGLRRLLLEKVPYAAAAAGLGLLARLAQQEHGATYSWADYGLLGRLAQAAYSLWWYLLRTVVPTDLCVLHPLQAEPSWTEPRFALAGIGAAAVTAALIACRRRWPALLTAWIAYGLLLAPVSGLAQAGPSLVAERYSYLPVVGFFVILAWALRHAARVRPGWRRPLVAAVAAVACTWGVLSWVQSRHWLGSVSLWRRAVAVHGDAVFARLNLGGALDAAARATDDRTGAQRLRSEAAEQYLAATELMPGLGTAWYYLGLDRVRLGDHGGALEALDHARGLYAGGHWTSRPAKVELLYMLGLANTYNGNHEQAIGFLREAIGADAGYVHSYVVLADLLAQRGERQQAITTIEQGLAVDPGNAALRDHLARLRQ